jgi:hypothetical protein
MTSPYVKTVLRSMPNRSVVKRRPLSLVAMSQRYLRGEHNRFLLLEVLIFAVLAATALWPMLDAAALIKSYLL